MTREQKLGGVVTSDPNSLRYWVEHWIPLNRLADDQRTLAERRWQEGAKPAKPQKACDIGLFSDDAAQLDLIECLQDPVNEEE